MTEFNPYREEHIEAYKHLCKTGCWPEGVTFAEVQESSNWPIQILQKLANAWIDNFYLCKLHDVI